MPTDLSEMPGAGPIAEASSIAPVLKTVRVRSNATRAFQIFTEGFDSWWPRTHHIGSSPMAKAVLEGRIGGRCYSEQADGTVCPWGRIVVWEPPVRFMMAWLISADWKFEPDPAKCSEVEVRFTPAPDGSTLVELEHRNFERMIAGGETMRDKVNQEGGWSTLMQLYRTEVEKTI